MKPIQNKTVWSTESGDLRRKGESVKNSISLPPQQQTVYLHREAKHRGGKDVTLLRGLILSESDLSSLAKTLKQACGTGGTIKDNVIEIRGEHRDKIAGILQKLGYKVKIAGG